MEQSCPLSSVRQYKLGGIRRGILPFPCFGLRWNRLYFVGVPEGSGGFGDFFEKGRSG